ncbi:MAG TPA: M23 family metallopeptidase [Candidatus Limnocylindria bacterium]|nr:M23 family metallopeptidase [Candidatus Limnocylindria bacterium]
MNRWGAFVLPDPQRPLRRLTHPLSRAVTHAAVIGLVASAAAFGISAVRGPSAGPVESAAPLLPFDLVSRVRGAADAAPVARVSTFDLEGGRVDPRLQSRAVRIPVATPEPTPLPTPVAPPPPPPEPVAVAAAPPPPPVIFGSGVLLWPVHGTITTYYSAAHLAIDIAVPAGTTVAASDAGKVIWAGWRNNGGGLVIEIDHGNGMHTVYNHLGAMYVKVGQAVSRGEGIAAVGCTGMCTGPHVHFEVIVDGVVVNPLRYL